MLDSYGDDIQLESWVQSKITIAEDYISKVKHFLETELNMSMSDPESEGQGGSDSLSKLSESDRFGMGHNAAKKGH